jgi:hypothetical protein
MRLSWSRTLITSVIFFLSIQNHLVPKGFDYLQIIRHAVSGMLPKNKLRDRRLERLKVFPGEHVGILEANFLQNWEDGSMPVREVNGELVPEVAFGKKAPAR